MIAHFAAVPLSGGFLPCPAGAATRFSAIVDPDLAAHLPGKGMPARESAGRIFLHSRDDGAEAGTLRHGSFATVVRLCCEAFGKIAAMTGRRPSFPIENTDFPPLSAACDFCDECACAAHAHLLHAARRTGFGSTTCGRGGIGRRAALRSLWGNPWKFESSRPHQSCS